MGYVLREKLHMEEVGECPVDDNLAVYEMGCCDCDNVVYLACPRGADLYGYFAWLVDMICGDCNLCNRCCSRSQSRPGG